MPRKIKASKLTTGPLNNNNNKKIMKYQKENNHNKKRAPQNKK